MKSVKQMILTIVVLLGLSLGFGMGTANAVPGVPAAVQLIASHGAIAFAAVNSEYTRECETEDNVLAKRPGESYSFEVSACNYQDNSDSLVKVE